MPNRSASSRTATTASAAPYSASCRSAMAVAPVCACAPSTEISYLFAAQVASTSPSGSPALSSSRPCSMWISA